MQPASMVMPVTRSRTTTPSRISISWSSEHQQSPLHAAHTTFLRNTAEWHDRTEQQRHLLVVVEGDVLVHSLQAHTHVKAQQFHEQASHGHSAQHLRGD